MKRTKKIMARKVSRKKSKSMKKRSKRKLEKIKKRRTKKRRRIKKIKKQDIVKIGNIYCLLGKGADCNTYVVKDKKNMLVDPGLVSKANKLKKIKLSSNKIHFVVNTHCHYDHSATNRLYKKSKIIAHKNAVKALENAGRECLVELYSGEMKKSINVKEIPKELDLGKSKFKVLYTPGHTKGSISLYEPKLKVLICGDLAFAYGWVGNTIYPGGSATDLKKSVRKISKLNVKYLLPGHGPLGTGNSVKKALETVKRM